MTPDQIERDEEWRTTLQRMYDAPATPVEKAYRDSELTRGSQPKEWGEGLASICAYGWHVFERGYVAGLDAAVEKLKP